MPCSRPNFFAASSKRASAFWYTFISSGAVPCDIPNAPLFRRKTRLRFTVFHTKAHNYGCSFFLRLVCDTQKISGLPTRNRATRPGRQYTNPFRLPASREAANWFQNVQCHEDLYPCEIVSLQPTHIRLTREANTKWQR